MVIEMRHDTLSSPVMAYNITGQSKELLRQYADAPSSLSVQLYPDYWTMNSGPKFLYNSPQATVSLVPLFMP